MTNYDKTFELISKLKLEDGEYEVTDALIEMAEWKEEQIRSCWHDSDKEQPNGCKRIVTINAINYNGEVGMFSEVYPNHLWAYLEDLLPRKEE